MKQLYASVIAFLILISGSHSVSGQIIVPFTIKKQLTQRGGIIYLANASLHCAADPMSPSSPCLAGASEMPPGGSLTNNSFQGEYVDIDNDPLTYMSSSDSLDLPPCSRISWAGLFWGSTRSATLTPAAIPPIKIKANNDPYMILSPASTDTNMFGGYRSYNCFADLTSFVQSAGSHMRLTVADIYTDRLNVSNAFGGWTLVVMFENSLFSLRQLTCFNGLSNVSPATTLNVPVSGFLTAPSGPVSFEAGYFVYDGDRGSWAPDAVRINDGNGFVALFDTLNPVDNPLNSTISRNGVLTPYRHPNLNNTAGVDADIFTPDNTTLNYLGNSVTTCTFQVRTSGAGGCLIQMLSMSIEVYEPNLHAWLKVKDVNGGTVDMGDILEYTVRGANIGIDGATNAMLLDTIEHNKEYVPNSIKVVYGPNAGAKTDAPGDDQAEYDAAQHLLRVRIGTGANSTNGGTVTHSPTGVDSTVVTYSVMVTRSCTKVTCDSVIHARVFIRGIGNISGTSWTQPSDPGILDSNGCSTYGPLEIVIRKNCEEISAAASPTLLCADESFTLTGNSDQEINNYYWTGPNNYMATGQVIVVNPATAAMTGVYTYFHEAYPGCARTATTEVTVIALPLLNIAMDPSTLCAKTTVTLTASGAISYTWSPGGSNANVITASPPVDTVYTLTGSNGDCVHTITVIVPGPCPPLFIPEGFSPNNDGVNDGFVIRGIDGFPDNRFTILNRWGNVVFKMDGYNNTSKNWKGTTTEGLRFDGDELPEGTYFYLLDLGTGDKPLSGFIYLTRTTK